MRELSDPDVLGDVQLGVDFVRGLHAQPSRVAVIGFCMGGTYALLAGTALERVAAVAPFYAVLSHSHGLLHAPGGLDPQKKPRSPLAAARMLRCPLLAFYGDRDVFVPASDIDALRAQLAASGQPFEVRVFPGAGHAFMNETRPQAFAPEAAQVAWERLFELLERELTAGA
jgi:carboxymethylenebutenolidase